MANLGSGGVAQVLFLSDTHLGLDQPARPRVERRRRGEDFFANYLRALAPALRREVDLVIHGGDVLDRPQVPPSLVRQAFEPLFAIARSGIPVAVVPGNHERSAIPYPLLAAHPRIHLFDRPRTFRLELGGLSVALAGFPFQREAVRARTPGLLAQTGVRDAPAQVKLLCLHQAVDGATVGPADFVFRGHPDVVRGADLGGFDAVLSGHIHRAQVLTRDGSGRALPTRVIYPGSVERTSFAERGERKGYRILTIGPGRVEERFVELPSRPMEMLEIQADGGPRAVLERVKEGLGRLPPDAVVRVRFVGEEASDAAASVDGAAARALIPATMEVKFDWSASRREPA